MSHVSMTPLELLEGFAPAAAILPGTHEQQHPSIPTLPPTEHQEEKALTTTNRAMQKHAQPDTPNILHAFHGSEDLENGSTLQPTQPTGLVSKYYAQRFRLFHRFDDGIRLDEEAWYSVTPEQIAAHQARRIVSCLPDPPVVLDACCGAAGNTIQFAKFAHVLAVDRNPKRLALARHNATVYGVERYIDFIVGDVYQVIPALSLRQAHVDAVFIAPPWGGPDYINKDEYSVEPFVPLVRAAVALTPNICLMVPRNASFASIQKHFAPCEMEYNYLAGKLKTVTLYFGNLVVCPQNASNGNDEP